MDVRVAERPRAMKPYVSDLVVNEEVTTFLFVSETPQVRQSKKKSDYLCLKLQDKTGTIDARLWDFPPGFDANSITKGVFVKVRGQVTEWNEIKQITISQIRTVEEGDLGDLGDFFERSERDPEEMFQELHNLIEFRVTNGPIKDLLFSIMSGNKEKLLVAPAGKTMHHAYLGGLLEHILSMANMSGAVCEHYELNRDLILAACVLHDIGKIHELTYPKGIGYSVEGTLLGHVSMGMDMVSKKIAESEDFPRQLKFALLHLMASHHGLLEYGSPKVPLMREAIGFHILDMLDARLAMCDRVIKKGVSDEGLTEWVKELGGPLFVLEDKDV
jgi:3'-5' exoribonuclease